MSNFIVKKFDGTPLQNICIACTVSKPFLQNFVTFYKSELMEGSQIRWIVDQCVEFYKKYDEAPKSHIQDIYEVHKDTLPEAEVKLLGALLLQLSNRYEQAAEEINVDYLLDQTQRWMRKRALEILKQDLTRNLHADNIEEARACVQKYMENNISSAQTLKGYTAAGIVTADISDPIFIVKRLIVTDAALLAGPPKIGKSWFALLLGLAVALGQEFLGRRVRQGGVLYLALEDSPARIRRRLLHILAGEPAPENIHFFTEWPKVEHGGTEAIEKFLQAHDGINLIIIDTLERIRPGRNPRGGNPYGEDYAAIAALKTVADKYGIAALIIHHTRKADARDWIERISGTMGHLGAADTLMVLERKRQEVRAALSVTGRDIEEQNLAVEFCPENGRWHLLGEASNWDMSPERQEIIEVLREAKEPMTPTAIAEKLGGHINNVRVLLRKMDKAGIIYREQYGVYAIKSSNSGNSSNSEKDKYDEDTVKSSNSSNSSTNIHGMSKNYQNYQNYQYTPTMKDKILKNAMKRSMDIRKDE